MNSFLRQPINKYKRKEKKKNLWPLLLLEAVYPSEGDALGWSYPVTDQPIRLLLLLADDKSEESEESISSSINQ